MSDHPGPLPLGASRADLVAEVAASLEGLGSGAVALVALSGGPDSTALAYLTAEARPDLDLALVHVRHGLRDDAEDRRVVATHAEWLGLPLEVRDVEVHPAGRGPAAAAREARHGALRAVARERGARAVLLGHTADDQAETLLLRLARGTGLDGLVGMRVHDGLLRRPLLRLRRADVHRFVLLEGLPIVEDPSNDDPAAGRARARHRALPAMAEIGPDPAAALARLADLAGRDAAALDGWAARVAAGARRVGPVVALGTDQLEGVPEAVARRVLRHLVVEVGGGPAPSAAAVARLASLAPGAALDLPGGVRATFAAGRWALAPRDLPRQDPTPVAIGERVDWRPAGLAVACHGPREPVDPVPGEQIALGLTGAWSPPSVRVDARLLPPGALAERGVLALPEELSAGMPAVWLRHREPGDRIALPAGTRRLKDLLIDAGVPRPVREIWPVVAGADGRVVWVPGLAADRDVLADGRARPAALLALARGSRSRASEVSAGLDDD